MVAHPSVATAFTISAYPHTQVPTGGYRDTQFQVMICIDGVWRYAEVQLNLDPFMRLKNQKDAGHGVSGLSADVSIVRSRGVMEMHASCRRSACLAHLTFSDGSVSMLIADMIFHLPFCV
jgi:hypothetical protein